MNSSEAVWSIGLMTGTVLDGNIDIALLKTDGEKIVEFGPHVLAQYDASVNQLLSEALELAQQWQFNGAEPSQFSEAEAALTKAQALAVVEFIAQTDIPKESIASIGFHGQTVLHRAPTSEQIGQTKQLGDGQLMADILGIPVVYDFRSADVNAGGQGAPLAAVYHAALLANVGKKHSGKKNMGAAKPSLADRQLPHIQLDQNLAKTAVLNLGGVANITWTDGKDNLVAFDTGPANAPINDFIQLHNEGSMDRGGKFAALGRVDEERLSELLRHPYLSAPFPKSLDRNDFGAAMAKDYSLTNGAALLTAFSASAVGKALDLLRQRPEQLIVCGGGRHNPTLMREIALRAQASVLSADDIGWHGDATEAECFAYLAVRHLRGLAFSYPGTTGVPVALCGGQLAQPSKR